MNETWQRNLGLLTLLAAILTACSSDPDRSSADPQSTPTSSGTASPAVDPQTDQTVDPILLRLGTGEAKTAPAADQIRWFAKRVGELTDGAITIKPVWLAAGDVQRFETAVAEQAIDGDLDLALVATRAWDAVGVETLAPLNAPFLVSSDELVARVVDEPIQHDLLAGLPEVGVVGIGLWPEGLRHPFGFGEPLNEPGDYDGTLIRAPYSATAQAMFRALDAKTTDGAPDPSRQRGAESAYRLAPAGVATANVVFYPKINALVANAELEAALTDAQRGALTQAAEDTRDWVLDTWPTDNELARTFCDEGGTIQSASPAQAKAMLKATRPVVDAMAADDVLGPIVEKIREAAKGVQAETPLADCGDETNAEALALLDGDYTFTVTAAAGRKAGVTDKEVLDNGSAGTPRT
jgi:TRAP-type C4-dicarboxylate transport system substrate-binding protein